MKTQIRPRVLIPVIALAVVVAAAAVWKLSSSGDEEPASTAAPAAGETSVALDEPGALDAGASSLGGWAQQANAICASAAPTIDPTTGGSQQTNIPMLSQKLDGQRDTITQLRTVSAPEASAAQLDQLVGVLERQIVLSTDALVAVEDGKLKRARKVLAEVAGLSKQRDELAGALGLTDCAADRTSTPTLGDLKLARAYGDGRPVVLVLYSSGADLDTAVLREARSAAGAAGAGFVALDGTKENDGGAIARVAGLRATPSTVVLRRDLGVATVIPGFADRETIAQAVANARRNATSS